MRSYIWYPDPVSGRIGHASLKLSDNKNSGKIGNKLGAGISTGYGQDTLADDVRLEGGPPTKVIDLDGLHLDEQAIEDWWFNWINGGTYTLLDVNCCKVVYYALRAGGAAFSINPVWSPGFLYRYLVRITGGWLCLAASFFSSSLV